MTYCVEPFIQDSVWRWLDANDQYNRISAEARLGDDGSAGRIDLIAETIDGEIHGFEIKNDAFADEQLNRYLDSGDLDKLFHCSRRGHVVADRMKVDPDSISNIFSAKHVRNEVSNAIAAGQYTESEYIERLETTFPAGVLEQQAATSSASSANRLDADEKTIRAQLTRNLGIPTADFEPDKEYIDLETAMERMVYPAHLPWGVGVIDVPFSYHEPSPENSFRAKIDASAATAFSKSRWQGIEICHEADSLSREGTPTFSQTNEAWVQHHTWWELGDIREGILPHPKLNGEFLIDVMAFKGGGTPTAVFQAGDAGKCIGIEAKGAATFRNSAHFPNVRDQLDRYRSSGALTHLYLSVPAMYVDAGEQILDGEFEDVGLITVDTEGDVTIIKDATRREMAFDSYQEVSGRNEYTRSIGFGSVQPVDEIEPTSPCKVRTEAREA